MITRPVLLILLAACSSPRATPAPVQHSAPPPEPTALTPLTPFIHAAPVRGGRCELAWDELAAVAEARIELSSAPPEDCIVEDMNPRRLSGRMRGGVDARMTLDGPAGSGRFVALDVAIGPESNARHACLMGSTVGWRLLHDVADQLVPLPWLDDVDGDGAAELVVWHRLPWGHSEVENALFPVVYVLDDDALVRRDDRARSLFMRVAAAYRTLARKAQHGEWNGCFEAVATFLESP